MNKAQKQIVKGWVFLVLFILSLFTVWESPLENKQLAGIIIAIPFLIWGSYNRELFEHKGYGPDGVLMGEFIKLNPILKFWLVCYCVCILPIIIYKLYTADETPYGLSILAFCLLVVPMFITSEILRYKGASEDA